MFCLIDRVVHRRELDMRSDGERIEKRRFDCLVNEKIAPLLSRGR